MRRFHAFLLSAGLVAAPTGALANPSDSTGPQSTTIVERTEWSSNKGRLGIMVMSLTPELRTFFGSTDKAGILVSRVEPGSPAALAGIAVGDLLVDVGGTKVDDIGDVLTALGTVPDGQQVKVKVLRDHRPHTFDVTLGSTATTVREGLPALDWIRSLFRIPRPEQA